MVSDLMELRCLKNFLAPEDAHAGVDHACTTLLLYIGVHIYRIIVQRKDQLPSPVGILEWAEMIQD